MKNIQVIDGADNCTYSFFAVTNEEFGAIFPNGTDIEFAEDFFERVGEARGIEITKGIWQRPVKKQDIQGIHGTLFYQLAYKKYYYPTRKESEFVDVWIPNLNRGQGGSSHGWLDDKDRVWCPTDWGVHAHGGPHWDVQTLGGGYINVYPPKQ